MLFLSACVCLHVKGPRFRLASFEITSYTLLLKSQRGDVLVLKQDHRRHKTELEKLMGFQGNVSGRS